MALQMNDYGSTDESPSGFNLEEWKTMGVEALNEGKVIGLALFSEGKEYVESLATGSTGLKYMSVLGGSAMVVSSILGAIFRSGIFHMLCQVYLAIFGAAICCMELEQGPFAKDEYKVLLKTYCHFLVTLYGRAAFYVFCATMLFMQWPFVFDLATGVYMAILSFVYIKAGHSAMKKMKALSMRDEGFYRTLFEKHDQDHDGFLNQGELQSLFGDTENGHLDVTESQAAMLTIDSTGEGKVSLRDFLDWYTAAEP